MDYNRVYDNLINKAKSENRKKSKSVYYETHHIIPRCIGGNNEKSNTVLLTAREHFVCHHLLCEIYDEPKLKYAFWAMCNQVFGDVKRDYKISSSTYEYAKLQFIKNFSEYMKNLPEERRGFKKGSKHSEETKTHWQKTRKGKFTGEDNSFFGKSHTEETKKKIANTRKERGVIPYNVGKIQEKDFECPHCKKKFSKGGLTQHLLWKHK